MPRLRSFRGYSSNLAAAIILALISAIFAAGIPIVSPVGQAPSLVSPLDRSYLNTTSVEFSFELFNSFDNCSIFIDGSSNYTWQNLSNQSISLELRLAEGPHNWSVECFLSGYYSSNSSQEPQNSSLDSNLNSSSNNSETYYSEQIATNASRFSVDITSPVINEISPPDYTNLTSRNMCLSFSITDNLDPTLRCSASVDGDSYQNTSNNISNAVTINVTLAYGDHNLNLSCVDLAGNLAHFDRGFTITPANISFDFTIDKNAYFIGEQVNMILLSPVDTNLRISIFKDFDFSPLDAFNTSIGNNRTIFFRSFADIGYYVVISSFDYYGYRGIISRNFTVRRNEILVTATSNLGYAKKDQVIGFEAVAQSNFSGVSFRWDLNNDGVYETEGRVATYSFSTTGDKTVKLQADDGYNLINQSLVVHIKEIHTAGFLVLDNSTGENLNNATVELGNLENITNATGGVSFVLLDGVYPLRVSKQEYYNYNSEITANQDMISTIRLQNRNRDIAPPEIYLIYPREGNQINATQLTAVFKVTDASQFNCTVFYSEYSNWYQAIEVKRTIQNNTETSVDIEGKPGNNYWRVECTDGYGNTGISAKERFVVSTAEAVAPTAATATVDDPGVFSNQVMTKLDTAIAGSTMLSPEEEEISTILGIKKNLDQAKIEVQKLRRDLSNLQFGEMTESETIIAQEKISESIKAIENTTITDFTIDGGIEYTKYPSFEDVTRIVERVAQLKGEVLTQKQKEKLSQRNFELQDQAIVKNKVWKLQLKYLSGRTEPITLVSKEISNNGPSEGVLILEEIPKRIAGSAKEIEFLTLFSVIDADPIIRLQLDNENKSAYYLRKDLEPLLINETTTILMYEELKDTGNQVTGFAALGAGGGKSLSVLPLVVVLAVIVLGILLYRSRVLTKKIPFLKPILERITARKNMACASELIGLASQRAGEGKFDDAKKLYAELNQVYKQLPATCREEIYSDIGHLRDELNILQIHDLIKEGKSLLMMSQRVKAMERYKKINMLYDEVKGSRREKIFQEIQELIWLMKASEKK